MITGEHTVIGESRKGSQCRMILRHLETAPITALEALSRYGCLRLGARIFDLRQAGHSIASEMIDVSSTGKPCRVARYRLVKKRQA